MPETTILPSSQPSLMDYVVSHGSTSARFVQHLADDFPRATGADIADICHFLSMLHGRHPGVVDHAATKTADTGVGSWLVGAMEAFAAERAYLTKLTVAAGPVIGVGSSDASNVAVLGQRKALEMLAQSDRDGCAIGASFALVCDWYAIRPLLDKIAIKIGVEPQAAVLPTPESIDRLNSKLGQTASVQRAINFGAEQILAQHCGLWQLLESRSKARQTGAR